MSNLTFYDQSCFCEKAFRFLVIDFLYISEIWYFLSGQSDIFVMWHIFIKTERMVEITALNQKLQQFEVSGNFENSREKKYVGYRSKTVHISTGRL